MEEARVLQPTARRCITPCKNQAISRKLAAFKTKIREKLVRAGMSREEAQTMIKRHGMLNRPLCAQWADVLGKCILEGPEPDRQRLWQLLHYYSNAATEEATLMLGTVVSNLFARMFERRASEFRITEPYEHYGSCPTPIEAQLVGTLLDKGNYGIGVAVLRGALDHGVFAEALGLEVLYVRAKRHGARIEFKPMCDLEHIRGKRALIIEDDINTGRTMPPKQFC